MYGAILGDIIGSPYEFDRGDKSKEFPLFCPKSKFTDDSVMTIAVCKALLKEEEMADVNLIKQNVIKFMQKWGRKYPFAGYGARFRGWLIQKNPKPYNSYGNGSAMRVSSVGWLYDSLERTREVARATAEVSHNHPEGIKEVVAIWWYTEDKEIWDFSKMWKEGELIGPYFIYSSADNHITLWESAVRKYILDDKEARQLIAKGYNYYEYGRIDYDTRTQTFEIKCSETLWNDIAFRRKCVQHFCMQPGRYEFVKI